jgi:uncharacterized protein YqhQ
LIKGVIGGIKMEVEKIPSYGGQALIEGVVMRGSRSVAAAMRAPTGEIVIKTEALTGIYTSKIRSIPFLRGLVILWDALALGIKFLTISANIQTGEEEKIEGPTLYLSLGGSLVVGVLIFFLGPVIIAQWLESLTGLNAGWGNIFEGILRLIFIIGYIWGIGFIPDIRRVFEYHGAEHKTINGFEAGAELNPENIKRFSLEHPRCGTSFLLTVMVFSILLFSALGPLPLGIRLISRIILIPVIAGFAYEYIRWLANHLNLPLVKILIKPNMALQHLTTREPSLDIIDVAITAFKTMLASEQDTKEKEIPSLAP